MYSVLSIYLFYWGGKMQNFYKRFHVLCINMNKDRNKRLNELSLTSSQADVLLYLICNQDKDITQKNIENTFNLTNPTVHGILKRLEEKDFILKDKNIKDARFNIIKITDKSKVLKEKITSEQEKITNALWENIDENEKMIFLKTLEKIEFNIMNRKDDNL